jgi:hypothetical protein
VNAPRAGKGPKRPPRPERTAPAAGSGTNGTAAKGGTTPTPGPASPAKPASTSPTPPRFGSVSTPAAALAVAERKPATDPPTTETAALATPSVPTPPRASTTADGRRVRRGRRVKRVLRRIDLWSVLKLSLVVYTCLYIAVLATLAVIWGILYQSGNVEKLQSFLGDVGLENFTFYGNQMFRACAAIGAVGVLAGTVITVLATALVNIISEMTGGIRLIVIEEDVEPR